jgi:hypothetical protein
MALVRLLSGTWLTHGLALAAQLGIADRVAQRPQRSEELARVTGMQAAALYRLLRALASVGVFEEDAEGRFRVTPLAELLRADVPGSLRDFAVMLGQEWHWRAWGDLPHGVQAGQSAFEHLYGMTNFAYWAQHPEAQTIFDTAMTSRGAEQDAAILASYDFAGIDTLVDVGGGRGSLLAAVLNAHPGMRGVLVDRPEVVPGATQYLAEAGLNGRSAVAVCDFFAAVPGGGDAYVLKSVLHDWDDERALTILRNCRRAMPNHGRLLVVEWVIPPGNTPSFGKLLDLLMLVWTPGGKERTVDEFRALLAAAGFELTGITPTRAGVSALEAVPR